MKAPFILAPLFLLMSLLAPRLCSAGNTVVSHTLVGETRGGLYAVASGALQSASPLADISIISEKNIQLVTVTVAGEACRAVLSDAGGQILRSRKVEDEVQFDFIAYPAGTYRLSILDTTGVLVSYQTLVKH